MPGAKFSTSGAHSAFRMPRRRPLATPLTVGAIGWPALSVVVGLLLITLITWSFNERVGRLALDQAARRATAQVDLVVADRMVASEFEPPFTSERLVAVAGRLDPVLSRLRDGGSGLLRVNIITRDGTILYSDLATIRGSTVPPADKPALSRALAGAVAADQSSLSTEENRDLRSPSGVALEVYVPVWIHGQVVGAYEIYEDPGDLHSVRSVFLAGLIGVGSLLTVVLAIHARRGFGEAVRAGAMHAT